MRQPPDPPPCPLYILLTAAAKIYPVHMRHAQTHHHALILLTAAAKIYPVSMRQPPDPPPCPHTAHCSRYNIPGKYKTTPRPTTTLSYCSLLQLKYT
ncbi:hypothetical protein DPMN_083247 [Dreissena polymorpha]|uniref:Uncharacterized protein n=1 Tax=Dreissena polymorpha TaxID=45954 RepID=A0A9D3Y8D8_DREPO|nr:hypothetical protein DPMN_083247 [Dreissena polymorpha]